MRTAGRFSAGFACLTIDGVDAMLLGRSRKVLVMALHEEINYKLRQLWKNTLQRGNWPPGLEKLWPIQYPPFRLGAVLFVGLNPSADLDYPMVRKHARALEIRDPAQFDDDRVAAEVVALEAKARGLVDSRAMHPFYRPFPVLAPKKYGWEHIDVFAVRATDQAKLKKALGLDRSWTEFARQQFRLFIHAVEVLRPVAMVVVNALASRLIQQYGSVPDDSFREDKGYHVWLLGGHAIPVFFSGTLTGKRALDVYSRNRLKWHIRWALAENF